MHVTFANRKVGRLCRDDKIAKKKLGYNCAKNLRIRLAEMRSVDTLGKLVAGNPHPLAGKRIGQFAVELSKGFRLVFVSDHRPTTDDNLDWSQICKVKIIEIGDYHG